MNRWLQWLVAAAAVAVILVSLGIIAVLVLFSVALSQLASHDWDTELDEVREDLREDLTSSVADALKPTHDELNALDESLGAEVRELDESLRTEVRALDESLSAELITVQDRLGSVERVLQEINQREAIALDIEVRPSFAAPPPRAVYGVRHGAGYEAFEDPERGWLTHVWLNPLPVPAAGRGWPLLHLLCRQDGPAGGDSLTAWLVTAAEERTDLPAITVSWRVDAGTPQIAVWRQIEAATEDERAFALDRTESRRLLEDLLGGSQLTMDVFVEDYTLLSYFDLDALFDTPLAAPMLRCGLEARNAGS